MDAIITVNSDQKIVLFNTAAESMFGYTAEEALGQTLDILIPARYREAHRLHLEHFAKTGQTNRSMGGLDILKARRRDGTEFPIRASISQTDVDGVKLLTAIVRDVTDLVRTSAQLERTINLLRITLDSTADGIIVLDSKGKVITFNKKYLEQWNVDPAQLEANNQDAIPRALMQLKDPHYVLQTFQEVMADRDQVWLDEIEFLDGRILERYSVPQQFDENSFGRVWCFRDITDRKFAQQQQARMQAQLLQAQKLEAIGTLAGGIAHDFNNILYGIRGYGELVESALDPGSQAAEDMKQVMAAAHRAEDLVRQILTFCRKGLSRRVPVGLPMIVKEVAKMMRSILPSTIEVKWNLEVTDATVIADPIEIHQVLVSLCTNAGQAMSEDGGVLEIGLRSQEVDQAAQSSPVLAPGDYFVLSVKDTGPGIADEIVGRIFEPFFTTRDVGEGTGLGLSIVHGVATELGGAVTIYSEPATGTEFQVYLPAATKHVEHGQHEDLRPGKERVLFVDDEQSIAQLGKKALASLGYRVEEFSSSFAALERFSASPQDFDILVTDETMPKLRGSELAKLISGIRPNLPIILCTGYSQRLEDQQLPSSVKKVLHKPLTRRDLGVAVRAVLDAAAAAE